MCVTDKGASNSCITRLTYGSLIENPFTLGTAQPYRTVEFR
jgi:hypothetical protein